jgi:hypothetical protein
MDGWTVRVSLRLPPGATLLGLSPHYTYSDYLRFLHSLPEGPLLRKVLLGHSDRGREHWALHISDPGTPPDGKLRFLLAARAHAYETFGSFAIEAMIRYLLSNPPEANLKHFDFEVLPMLNVEGVAVGYEFAVGFEHGPERDLHAGASGRLYFARIDALRPHILVTLHNWITPRSLDVISYTDVDARGRRIDRAQEIFRGFLPPQTEFGKRWLNDVDTPLAHNWAREDEKQTPNLANPEIYARIRYRAELWVPEFPWFGRDDGDPAEIARETGRQYIRALLQTLIRLHPLPGAVLEEPEELLLLSACDPANITPAAASIGRDALVSGQPLVLDRVQFTRGLAVSLGASVTYDLAGQWDAFAAVVGLAGPTASDRAVELYVEGDGAILWSSGKHSVPDRRQRVEVDVRGVNRLTLGSRALAGSQLGAAIWGDAKARRQCSL